MAGLGVGQELECCVCLEQFVKPKLLSCMHTLCEGCIDQLIQGGTVICPTCRVVTKAPNAGAAELSTNYIAQNIIEKIKIATKKGPFCHDCTAESPAMSHCETCVLNLCQRCAKYHHECVRFIGHKIIDIGNVAKKIISPKRYCPKHNELLKYFCEQCKVTVCNDCMISAEHKQHSISLASEAIDKAKSELNQELQKMKESEKNLVHCQDEVQAFYEQIVIEDQNSVELIKQVFNEIRDALAIKEDQLIEQVAIQSETTEDQKRKHTNLSNAVNKVSQSVKYVESVLNESCDDLDIICNLSKHLDEVTKEYGLPCKYNVSKRLLKIQPQNNRPPCVFKETKLFFMSSNKYIAPGVTFLGLSMQLNKRQLNCNRQNTIYHKLLNFLSI